MCFRSAWVLFSFLHFFVDFFINIFAPKRNRGKQNCHSFSPPDTSPTPHVCTTREHRRPSRLLPRTNPTNIKHFRSSRPHSSLLTNDEMSSTNMDYDPTHSFILQEASAATTSQPLVQCAACGKVRPSSCWHHCYDWLMLTWNTTQCRNPRTWSSRRAAVTCGAGSAPSSARPSTPAARAGASWPLRTSARPRPSRHYSSGPPPVVFLRPRARTTNRSQLKYNFRSKSA